MKLRKKVLSMLICLSLVLTSFGTAFAAEPPQGLQKDENETYLISTSDELFAFAELAAATAEADKAAGSTRTPLSAKLTADIDLNPGVTFTYDHETGLVTVAKGGNAYKMGTGMKDTELGNFHPVYNGLCTLDEWNDTSITEEQLAERRNDLIAQMNEKIEALGLVKWTPIGTYSMPYIGYFDGNGHTIDGLYINDNTVCYTGLFGVTGNYAYISDTSDYGEVKNITVGEHSLIVGYKADANGATGAIVGMTNFDKITGCANYATVVGKGSDRLALSNSGLVGGIVGYANNDVKNCTNHGTVVSRESAGGIVGNIMGNQYQQGNVIYCANYGNVYAEAHSANGYAGGIAINSGVGSGTAAGCGGNVEACVNYGYVEGYYVGGVIYRGSQNTQVKYCANLGTVAGTSFASGVITFIARGGFTMEGCFNAGKVTALPYNGDGTVNPRVFPLVASVDTYDYHTVKNCYNDETVCPSGGAIFRDGVEAVGSYGVTTEFFATGEPAYKMGSYDKKGWRQNLSDSAEDGMTPETYPTTDGTRRVYEVVHYCCHTDDANKQAHKKVFYSNTYGNITDEHTPSENGICSHCKKDLRLPILFVDTTPPGDTLPEAKAGESYSVIIRASSDTPSLKDYIKATVSETDDTPYTFTNGLTGVSEYHRNGYYYSIYGCPTEAGEVIFTLSATNENGTTGKTYTLKINESDPLAITSNSKLANATAGQYYSSGYFMSTTSFNKTWSLKEGSELPDGLTLYESPYNDFEIIGTPTKAGDYTFTLVVSAEGQTAEKTFTLKIFEEGGCKHGDKTLIKGTPATCRHDGVADYYRCNICDCDIDMDGNEIWNIDNLKSASNHSDKNNDGKCDFCDKNMPIFKKVSNESGIVYGGTYIFVTEIDGKYYALATPTKGKYELSYDDFMNLCEITPEADGSFDFNKLEASNAIMLKTEFAAEGGNLDAGTPRYGLSFVFENTRYGMSDENQCFWMYPNEPAKYGYRISIDAKTGNALVGSVFQDWWSTPETAENGLLRAFDMTYNGESTKLMSLYPAGYYNGEKAAYSGATMEEYPIYLYRMTAKAQTSSGVTFITNDNNSNIGKGDFTELPDAIDLSNVNGIASAVEQTYVESLVETAVTAETEVIAGVYAEIEAVGFEKETSLRYSVTPNITVTDKSGNVLYEGVLPDDKLNGDAITVTLYTGGFEPEQIIHYKNDGTKEYFYGRWSYEAMSGAKTFEYDNGYVTFTVDSFSEIEILKTSVPEDEPIKDVKVNAIGVDAAKYSVSGQIVTVTHDKACRVGYLDGEAYKALTAVKIEDGKYSFTVPDGVDEVILVVKGDVDGDGFANTADETVLARNLLNPSRPAYRALNKQEVFALDLDNDGVIGISDKALFARILLLTTHPAYKSLEW